MDTSFLDAVTASGMPLINSPAIQRVTLENPSTLELALIGVATIAVYWAVRRLLQPGKGEAIAAHAPQERRADGRRQAA